MFLIIEKQVKENIEAHTASHVENKFIDDLVNKAMETMEVEVPHPMIHEEIDRKIP